MIASASPVASTVSSLSTMIGRIRPQLTRAEAASHAAKAPFAALEAALPAGFVAPEAPVALAGLPEPVAPATLIAGEIARHSDGDAEDDEIDNLVTWKAIGMTPEYAAEIRAAGFPQASMEDLLDAKAVGVTPDLAREVRRWDPRATLEEVVEVRAVGLTPAYIGEMRTIFPNLDLEGAVEMRALGVTAAFAREMRSLFPRATGEEIAEMKAVGVTPAFVREMRNQGLSAQDPDEAIDGRLFSHGPGGVGRVATAAAEAGGAIAVSVSQSVVAALGAHGPNPAPGPKSTTGPRPPATAD